MSDSATDISTTEEAPRRKLLRFSLLNVLVVITMVAMALVIWQLIAEKRALKSKLPVVTWQAHENPGEYFAVPVATYEENRWRWKLWLPEGSSYRLVAQRNQVPTCGLPGRQSAQQTFSNVCQLYGGEQELLINLLPGENGSCEIGAISVHYEDPCAERYSAELPANGSPWPAPTSQPGTLPRSRPPHEVEDSLVLLRHKKRTSDVSDGLLLWIEPIVP